MIPPNSQTQLAAAPRAGALLTAALALLPLLLQLPPTLALTIGAVALFVALASWRRPLPALLRLLLAATMLAGVFWWMGTRLGRDTGCALLAAMLAIKPAETATLRDARSLVGFALFAPFAAFLLDQGPASMALGLLAALAALFCLQQLADAEAGLPVRAPSPRQLGTTARLVALGLPLMLAAFWLFPRLGTPLWGVPDRAVARLGLSDRMTPDDWIDLLADDSPALRVQFFGAMPPMRELYWRGPVLLDFDGRTWTQPQWLRGLPPAAAVSTATIWDYEIELEPTDRRQLVALDLPLVAPAEAALSHDYGLYAPRPLSSVSRWRMRSAPPAQFEPQLRPTLRRMALQLPDGFNPRTLALARQWRREAGDDDAAIVLRALEWVRAEFAYTLDAPPIGRDGIDEFLFQRKSGYCENFSSAFVVLMRGADIPARVVTGYVGGYRNPFGGYWVVRRMDAHAWAEVWLPQRGWVRVDPTAAVAPERVYDTLEDRLAAETGPLGGLGKLWDFGDWVRRGWNDWVLGFDAKRQQRLLQPLGLDELDPRELGLLFGLCALLALGGMLAWLARGQRETDPLLRAWRALGRRYARLGLGREAHEPALEWAERVARSRPQAARTLLPLSHRFANSRYADIAGDTALARDLRRHRP